MQNQQPLVSAITQTRGNADLISEFDVVAFHPLSGFRTLPEVEA